MITKQEKKIVKELSSYWGEVGLGIIDKNEGILF